MEFDNIVKNDDHPYLETQISVAIFLMLLKLCIDGTVKIIWNIKGQYHGRYHDFWPKLTKFKL